MGSRPFSKNDFRQICLGLGSETGVNSTLTDCTVTIRDRNQNQNLYIAGTSPRPGAEFRPTLDHGGADPPARVKRE